MDRVLYESGAAVQGQQPDAGLQAEVERLQGAVLEQELAAIRYRQDAAGVNCGCHFAWKVWP